MKSEYFCAEGSCVSGAVCAGVVTSVDAGFSGVVEGRVGGGGGGGVFFVGVDTAFFCIVISFLFFFFCFGSLNWTNHSSPGVTGIGRFRSTKVFFNF